MTVVQNLFQHYFKKKKNLPFSIDAYLTAKCSLDIYQNSITFTSPFKLNHTPPSPDRSNSDITGFSASARHRMMLMFTRIDYSSYYLPLFASNTFHYDFKLDRIFLKKTLDNYLKRLKRQLPEFDHIWKLELQEREAPHFHFMFLFKKNSISLNFSEIKKIIEKNWLDLKMCNCEHCQLYSVKTKKINEYKHAMIYISKEIGKITQNNFKCDIGIYWNHSRSIRIRKYESIDLNLIQIKEILLDYFYTHPEIKINEEYKTKILNEPYTFTLFASLSDIENSIKKVLNERNKTYSFKEKYGLTKQQLSNLSMEIE